MARPKKEETLKPLLVRISDATRIQLKIESKKNGISISEYIRRKLDNK